MNARPLSRSVFGICILALALSTGVVQATGSKTPETSGATAANNTTSTPGESKASTPKQSTHHAASHKSSRTHHKHMASATRASDPETAYRAALKSCLEGPA